MKKKINKKELEKAEQQIRGFFHCYEGYDIKSLLEAMGFTKEEYSEMVKKDMLSYLPQELGDEIIAYVVSK